MPAAVVYLVISIVLLLSTIAAINPRVFGSLLSTVMSLAAMVLVFFIPQVFALGVLITVVAAHYGALSHAAGQVGFCLHLFSWALMLGYLWRMSASLPILDGVSVRDDDQPFCDGMTEDERRQLKPGMTSWAPTITYKIPAMLGVEVTRDVVYRTIGRVHLKVDVYRRADAGSSRPAVLYIHGGGWFTGSRRQSRFMMYELAAAGWTAFAISYRRAPRFPLPGAIEDAKAAVAWIREHAAEYGASPDKIVVMGGSAGGHLAAMVALTPDVPRFQPGFEEADTRVDGAVVLYGASDLAGAFESRPHPGLALLLERIVFRARYRDNPDLFRDASPTTHLHADVPPVLLVHGSHDHVIPIAESRHFAEKLKAAGARTVHMLEVPLGQHAFEVFPSPLHQRAVRVIVRFIETLRAPKAVVEAAQLRREAEAIREARQEAE